MTEIQVLKKFFRCFILPVYVCKLLSDIGTEKSRQSLTGHYLSILLSKKNQQRFGINTQANRVVSVKKCKPLLLSNLTGLVLNRLLNL